MSRIKQNIFKRLPIILLVLAIAIPGVYVYADCAQQTCSFLHTSSLSCPLCFFSCSGLDSMCIAGNPPTVPNGSNGSVCNSAPRTEYPIDHYVITQKDCANNICASIKDPQVPHYWVCNTTSQRCGGE